jgi:hypothetical protein
MKRPAVLLLEDNPHEATLAESALLFVGAQVVESPERAVVAVLGRKALAEYSGKLKIPAVAIVPDISEAERRRALAAGVQVYERPPTWQGYTALLGRALAAWLPTRKD